MTTISTQSQRAQRNIERILTMLRRIPDAVILSAASHIGDVWVGRTCLVGTVVRDMLLATTGQTASREGHCDAAARLFGGTVREWKDIYLGVVYTRRSAFGDSPFVLAEIETALVLRIDEAVAAAEAAGGAVYTFAGA